MATFERYFIDDDDMKIEKKNFYYDYINKPECAQRILEEFGLHDKRDHIIKRTCSCSQIKEVKAL